MVNSNTRDPATVASFMLGPSSQFRRISRLILYILNVLCSLVLYN
jgi:hypothetical protein